MRTLIQSGADVNARISNSFTPLHAAVCSANPFHKNEPSVRILLDNKADPYERTEGVFDGYNALHLAAAHGKWVVVGMLLDIGMDIESPTTSSNHPPITPLACAIRGLYTRDFKFLCLYPLGLWSIHRYDLGSSLQDPTIRLLLERNADLDGGSIGSRPKEYFRDNIPPGEKPDPKHLRRLHDIPGCVPGEISRLLPPFDTPHSEYVGKTFEEYWGMSLEDYIRGGRVRRRSPSQVKSEI